jgi:hypothetical protein
MIHGTPIRWVDDQGGHLLCPRCGGYLVHHDQIDVYDRDEDADDGLHVKVVFAECNDSDLTVDKDLSLNPSSRRDGMSIKFHCERCPEPFWLHVSQHKGYTDIFVSGSPPTPEP